MGMSATEKVVNDLNVSKLMLCNPKMLTSEMCVRIGQAINGAIDLLKEQEAKKVEWRIGRAHCPSCGELFPRKKETQYIRFCSFCGQAVKWE